MIDRRPQPIGSVAARGHSQWEAVIGCPAALIPLREATEGVSASLSSKQSDEKDRIYGDSNFKIKDRVRRQFKSLSNRKTLSFYLRYFTTSC